MAQDPNSQVKYDIENYAKFRPDYVPEIFSRVFERANIQEGSTVIDIGSGPGNTAAPLLEHGVRVYAVDPDPGMLEASTARFEGNDNFSAHEGTAQNTGLDKNEKADLIVAGNVAILWETIAKGAALNAGASPEEAEKALRDCQQDVLEEFRSLLKPNGKLTILFNKYKEDAPVNKALHDLLIDLSKPNTYEKKISRLTNAIGFRPEDYALYFEDGKMDVDYEHYDVELKSGDELWGFLMAHTFFDQGKNLEDLETSITRVHAFFDKYNENGVLKIPHYSCAFTGNIASKDLILDEATPNLN